MSSLTLLPSNAVAVSHGAPTTTSLVVAEVFGKRHADVLRDIDNLECSPEFHERNFAFMVRDVQIGSGAVRQDRYCEMTKDGFAFQVMGYTGPKAAQFKEAYINRFNEMEAALRQPQAPPDINRVHRWNAVHTANRWVLLEIPSDACILPPSEWPGVIRTTDFPRDLLPDVLNAVGERMKGLPPPGQGRPERNFAPTFRDVSRKVLGFIERYGRVGLARRDLISGCKPFRNLDSDKRGKLILQMLEDETIAEVETRSDGKGRPGKRLVHTKFINKAR